MPKSLEDHAENFDLRHEDFKDPDYLVRAVFAHARQGSDRAYRLPISEHAGRRRMGGD